jgi:hypothetical protein
LMDHENGIQTCRYLIYGSVSLVASNSIGLKYYLVLKFGNDSSLHADQCCGTQERMKVAMGFCRVS